MKTIDSNVAHELLMAVVMVLSWLEMQPDTVSKMDHGAGMLLAALVSMVEHKHLTVVIIGTSSRENDTRY